jgi:16S rRNA (cytosine1402-N4)-methyltransferase
VDATVGGGGHAREILKRLSPAGRLIGLDRDPEALEYCREKLGGRIELHSARFSELESALQGERGLDGILFDFGVSSHQLDEVGRGFSHRFEGPLDLRMNSHEGQPASILLGAMTEADIGRVLREYGEESQWRRIARAISRAKIESPLTTTSQLALVIATAVPATRIKSLARVFQALRILVNDELGELERGLTAGFALLSPGGRLVTISYHSLEDRPVKNFMREQFQPASDPRLPFPTVTPLAINLTRQAVKPGAEEVQRNPRSRSARLRAIEKL